MESLTGANLLPMTGHDLHPDLCSASGLCLGVRAVQVASGSFLFIFPFGLVSFH